MSTATQQKTETVDKKLQHYRNLNALENTDVKPVGWDEAKPFESLPGPKSLPVIGNMWRFAVPIFGDFYGKDFLDITKQLKGQYGDICFFADIMETSFVMLFDPQDFETVTRNEGVWPIRRSFPSVRHYQGLRKEIFRKYGLLISQGEDWFKFRTVVNPVLMQPRNIQQYASKMNAVADEFIQNIKYFAEQDKDSEMPDDFKNEIHKWALESVGLVTLDTHLGCLKRNLPPDSQPQQMINSGTQLFESMYILDLMPSLYRYISTPAWRQLCKAMDFITKTSIEHINAAIERLESEENSDSNEIQSVLRQLLKTDKDIAIAMAVDMLLAGIDTTGRVLGAGLYFLSKNPDKQKIFREQAKSLLPDKDTPVTKEVLAKATYAKAVIKETARLAPIAVGNIRTTVKDLVLKGYQIPKNTDVITYNLVASLDARNFPRPKEFLPERWLATGPEEISHKTANPFIYAPFGLGSRSCIGKRLAYLEMEIALLKIIRNFELSWHHPDMVFETKALYGFAKPLKLRVKPVDS